MPSSSPALLRSDRPMWAVTLSLAAAAVAVGQWPLSGVAATHLPALALPPAAGLPFLWPSLRLSPLAATTWTFWAAETVAALVMLLTAFGMLRARARTHPEAGPARAFARAVWVSVVAVIAGNLVRGVFLSVVTHAGIGMYVGLLVAGVIVSAITGLILGLAVGIIAALATLTTRRRHVTAPADDDELYTPRWRSTAV